MTTRDRNPFSVGDKVQFLTERGEGVVTALLGAGRVQVRIEEGLELPFSVGDLIRIDETERAGLIEEIEGLPLLRKTDPVKKPAPGRRKAEIHEIDLHMEEIVEDTRGLSNADKLALQLSRFREAMLEAMDKRWTKLVVIHGVGEGVLRSEIRKMLDTWPNTTYYDASYRKYGFGATEIRIGY